MNANGNTPAKPNIAPAAQTKPTAPVAGSMAVPPKDKPRKECEIITRLKDKDAADGLYQIILQMTGGDALFVDKFVECCKQQVNKHWKRVLNKDGKYVWTNPFLAIPLNSQIEALFKCAAKKILPDGYNCNLVPYLGRDEKKVEVSIDYKGLIDCAIRDGIIKDCDAMEVCTLDKFKWELGEITEWTFDPRQSRGDVCGYAAWAILPDGRKKWKFMRLEEINEVRACAKTQNIWKKWYGEMAKKTVIRRLFKTLRNTPTLQNLMSLDNEEFIEMEEADGSFRQKRSTTPVRRVVGGPKNLLPPPSSTDEGQPEADEEPPEEAPVEVQEQAPEETPEQAPEETPEQTPEPVPAKPEAKPVQRTMQW